MIGVWHEGALGDLLLSRLAVAFLKRRYGRLVLYARNEARKLYEEAGLADKVFSTEYGGPKDLDLLLVFARSAGLRSLFEKAFSGKVRFIETRPEGRQHVALFQLEKAGGREIPAEGLILRPAGFRWRPQYLLCHPGSGGRRKCYPPEKLRPALESLQKQGLPLRIILGPAERDLEGLFGGFEVLLSSDLETALKALSGARLFVGNDSGLTHLAAALGLPTLALFGPTDPWLWAPFGGRTRVLYPFSHLGPERLAREIKSFLSTTARSHPEKGSPVKEGRWAEKAVEPWGAGRSDTAAEPDIVVEAETEKRWEPGKPDTEAVVEPGEPRERSGGFEGLDSLGVEVVVAEAGPGRA